MGKQVVLTIVRHGETVLNFQKVLQGHTDTPLSNVGIKQATILGKKMTGVPKFTKAYSSDLNRAYHTAQLIIENSGMKMDIVKDANLRERSYGKAEGHPSKNLQEEAKKRNIPVHEYTPEGAETSAEVQKRTESFMEHIATLLDTEDDDEEILVVSHGGWIQCLMRSVYQSYINRQKYILEDFEPSKALTIYRNTSVTTIAVRQGEQNNGTRKMVLTFKQVNDVSHLNEDNNES